MLKGIDISKWQATSAVDQAQDFVIIKATEGAGYVDATCDTKYQYAKSKGKLLGVYHFARPDLNGAVAEAEFFCKNTTGYWKNKEAILVLDWEVGNTRDVNWALTWLKKVKELTGVKPLIYMSASVVASANWNEVVNNDFGLWIAGYPSKYNVKNPPVPAEGEMPYTISPWKFAAIWQYTSSAGTLDRNVAYMSKEAWGKYAGKTAAPVVTTKDETETTSIPFETTRTPDSTKLVGEEVVVQDGVNGIRTVVTRITYTNGVETSRSVVSDRTTAPKKQVVYYGTKEPAVEQPTEPETPVVSTPEPPQEEPEKQPPVVVEPTPNPSTDTKDDDLNQLQGRFGKLVDILKTFIDKIIAWVKSLINKLKRK